MPPKKFDLKSLVASGVPQKEEGFKLIPISDLHEHPSNSIFPISDDAVEDLAGTIALNGLLTPLTVTPREDGGYWIVSGSTRKRAVSLLGWESVRCEVQHFKSETYLELALLTANVSTAQRTDRRSCFYAAGEKYKELRMKLAVENGEELPELSVRDIAEAIGTSKSEYQRQRTIKEKLADAVERRWPNLPTSTALEFCKLSPDHQAGFAKIAFAGYRPEQKQVEEFREAIAAGDDPVEWMGKLERKIQNEAAAKRQRMFEEKAEAARIRKSVAKCTKYGGTEPAEKCNKRNGGNCKQCCGECEQAFFCEKTCERAMCIMKQKPHFFVAKRAREVRSAAGESQKSSFERPNAYFWNGGILAELAEFAKKYNVSTDYLLGITDTPQPAAPAAPGRFAETWKELDEEEPENGMDVIICYSEDGLFNIHCEFFWTTEKKRKWLKNHSDVFWTLPPEAVQF